ncbi:hypothetical protein FIV42_02270 [Persicimonas caeni]|uniref:Bacterial surface antigen (D15) domain-containing protein n=1 Tax=Persicimonas caeni TaxID=2292766 RepID=A0A4Y6PMU9_PERCE|nr:BamA/TamA family outer membrane protein [Persicimonas caeni]QDG49604.1 hypothetical protein FIV42_02270 [Persicimonas caeni]QED30825.1 BamA/TamA family outer membrane protein [Persicimonas caeni]
MRTTSTRRMRVLVFVVITCVCSVILPSPPLYAADADVAANVEAPDEAGSDIELKGFPVAAYTPETSLTFAGFGLLLVRPDLDQPDDRTSSVLAAGAYTLNDQWLLNLSPNLFLDGGAYNVKASVSLLKWPNSFYGIGAQVADHHEERFDATAFVVSTSIRRRVLSRHLYLGVDYEFARRSIVAQTEGLLRSDSVVGSDGGLLSAVGVNFAWDTRDNSFAATEGSYVQGSVLRYSEALGGDFSYTRFRLDGRHYVDLGHQQVLALQGMWESHVGDVPFYKLAKLGGQKRLRGLFKGRYRDKNMLLAQAEYRTPPLWRLRLAGFGGIGEVYGDDSPLSVDNLLWSAGAGLRLAVDESEGVNVRADFGLSPEGTGFYLSIGEAF